jgi:hypothetical protein
VHEIIINFQTDRNDRGYAVHALHVDAKTVLEASQITLWGLSIVVQSQA